MLVGEQGEVFVEGLAESVAGIDNDVVASYAYVEGFSHAYLQAGADQRKYLGRLKWWQGAPFAGTAAAVHQDDAALQAAASIWHFRIPHEAAHVIYDFRARIDGSAGC